MSSPVLGPDATGIGWIYEYALRDKSGQHDLAQLRTIQDFTLRYALESVPGVAQVASVGGYERQYQVTLDPDKLRAYGLGVAEVADAIRNSNGEVGGRLLEMSGREYFVRGRGYFAEPGRPFARWRFAQAQTARRFALATSERFASAATFGAASPSSTAKARR